MIFSFIVPVCNTSKYLRSCVGSLLCQNGDFEILLIDDGSSDESAAICDEYAFAHPETVRVVHKKNEGLLLTRRRGFKEASGDWLICVDSDDYVEPDLLEVLAACIREHDCDMVMYNFDYADDDGNSSPSRLQLEDVLIFENDDKQAIYEKRLLTVDANSMCMRAIRRDILDLETDYSGFGIKNMCEDALQDLAVYTNSQKITYLARPLYHYRKGHDSTTSKLTLDNWRAIYTCHVEDEKYLEVWNVSDLIKSKYYTKNCEKVVNFFRWLAGEDDRELFEAMVKKLRNDAVVRRSFDSYERKHASTRYMGIVTPLVVRLARDGNFSALEKLFRLERKFLAR